MAVLATVILLTYNTFVRSTITILSVAHVSSTSGSDNTFVWRYDSEINYSSWPYLVLTILACSDISLVLLKPIHFSPGLCTISAKI